MAALRPVDVGDMDLDVGDPVLEPRHALADLLLEAKVALGVALDLVVGMNLDEQAHSPHLLGCTVNARGAGEFPLLGVKGHNPRNFARSERTLPLLFRTR